MIKGNWGAIKLPLTYDSQRLCDEIRQIRDDEWWDRNRPSAAFAKTKAIFLKGYPAYKQNPSMEEREELQGLPYTKELIYSLIPAEPLVCVLSYLPPQIDVGVHSDEGEYFEKSLRIHLPVVTNKKVTMYFGACYKMKPGEVWLVNNNELHGVENKHKAKPRIHLIRDYVPSQELLQLIDVSDKVPGKPCPELPGKLEKKIRKYSK